MPLVPSHAPDVPPGAKRLAVVLDAPDLESGSWTVCPRGHGYPAKVRQGGTVTTAMRCPHCHLEGGTPSPTPLVGAYGRMFDYALSKAGLARAHVFVGYLDPVVRDGGFAAEEGLSAQMGARRLAEALTAWRPNCVLLLGEVALRAFHPDVHGGSLDDWRGSLFASDFVRHQTFAPGDPLKCVATYSPRQVAVQPAWSPLWRFDVARAVEEAGSATLVLPRREAIAPDTAGGIVSALHALRSARERLGFDIEGWPHTGVTLCSFAFTPHDALVVPFVHKDGTRWWSPGDEALIWGELRSLLSDPDVPKVCHNGLYEMFVLKWAHGVTLRGLTGDTMLGWHELYCELDKALDKAASVLTREPFWKWMYDAPDDPTWLRYNAIDSMVTLELEERLEGELDDGQKAHYAFNVRLLEPAHDQMMRGFAYDVAGRERLVEALRGEVRALQGALDAAAGRLLPGIDEVAAIACRKVTLRKWAKEGKALTWEALEGMAKPTWAGEADEQDEVKEV